MKIVVCCHSREAQQHHECQLQPRHQGNAADTKIAGADPIGSDNEYEDNTETVNVGRHYMHQGKREDDEVKWVCAKWRIERGGQVGASRRHCIQHGSSDELCTHGVAKAIVDAGLFSFTLEARLIFVVTVVLSNA